MKTQRTQRRRGESPALERWAVAYNAFRGDQSILGVKIYNVEKGYSKARVERDARRLLRAEFPNHDVDPVVAVFVPETALRGGGARDKRRQANGRANHQSSTLHSPQ